MRKLAFFAAALVLVLAMAMPAFADEASTNSASSVSSKTSDLYSSKNEETGNVAVIVDSAHLLSDEEETELEEYLDQMTQYVDAIFFTSDTAHSSSMHEYAKSMLEQIGRSVGMTDGRNAVIYVIDMNKRQLQSCRR